MIYEWDEVSQSLSTACRSLSDDIFSVENRLETFDLNICKFADFISEKRAMEERMEFEVIKWVDIYFIFKSNIFRLNLCWSADFNSGRINDFIRSGRSVSGIGIISFDSFCPSNISFLLIVVFFLEVSGSLWPFQTVF